MTLGISAETSCRVSQYMMANVERTSHITVKITSHCIPANLSSHTYHSVLHVALHICTTGSTATNTLSLQTHSESLICIILILRSLHGNNHSPTPSQMPRSSDFRRGYSITSCMDLYLETSGQKTQRHCGSQFYRSFKYNTVMWKTDATVG